MPVRCQSVLALTGRSAECAERRTGKLAQQKGRKQKGRCPRWSRQHRFGARAVQVMRGGLSRGGGQGSATVPTRRVTGEKRLMKPAAEHAGAPVELESAQPRAPALAAGHPPQPQPSALKRTESMEEPLWQQDRDADDTSGTEPPSTDVHCRIVHRLASPSTTFEATVRPLAGL